MIVTGNCLEGQLHGAWNADQKISPGFRLVAGNTCGKTYVSRQTISNWENDKSYPDIQSLLLLSALFDDSLDQFVKGDVETMKERVTNQEVKRFNRSGIILAIMFLVMVVSAVPLIFIAWPYGTIVWGIICVVSIGYAFYIEKEKNGWTSRPIVKSSPL